MFIVDDIARVLCYFQFPILGALVCTLSLGFWRYQIWLGDLSRLFPGITPPNVRNQLKRAVQRCWGRLASVFAIYWCMLFTVFSLLGGYLQ